MHGNKFCAYVRELLALSSLVLSMVYYARATEHAVTDYPVQAVAQQHLCRDTIFISSGQPCKANRRTTASTGSRPVHSRICAGVNGEQSRCSSNGHFAWRGARGRNWEPR